MIGVRGSSGPDGRTPEVGVRVAGLVLAAGRSRRMGALNKVLEEVDGVPLVVAVARTLRGAGLRPLLVVTGHDAASVRMAVAAEGVEIVHNPDYASGIGTSVARGVAALDDEVDAAVIALADMPSVSGRTVRTLLRAFEAARRASPGSDGAGAEGEVGRASAFVPVHGGRRGNPVLWGARLFPAHRGLRGDEGGRTLFEDRPEIVREVVVDDPGVLMDVDTPDALEDLRMAHDGPRP